MNKDFDRIYAEYKNGSGSTSDGKEHLTAVTKRRLGLRGGHDSDYMFAESRAKFSSPNA